MKKLLLVFLFISNHFCEAQNVGIGTNFPKARLHVADSNVVFTGPAVLPANAAEAPITGTGNRFMWYADMGALRSGGVETVEWNKAFTGKYSVAMGYNNVAEGRSSVSFGEYSYSASPYSSSFGYGSSAIAEGAFASGSSGAAAPYSTGTGSSIAAGSYSFSSGFSTRSNAYASFTAGSWNDISDNPVANTAAPTDRLFQLGNGSAANNRKNALTILRNGNTGLGTLAPAARLHVADSSVVFTAARNLPAYSAAGEAPIKGSGNRMMWYADMAAFRVGGTDSLEWSKIFTGQYSVAMGHNVAAAGKASFAMGEGCYSAYDFATALGSNSTSANFASLASGTSTALGAYSTATGRSTAIGVHSFSTGLSTEAKADGSFVSGYFNDLTDNPVSYAPAANDRIFQVGNGTGESSRNNAMTILRNGNMGIGTTAPGFPLNFSNSLGDKISFYGNSGNHYGLGIQSGLFQMHTDASSAHLVFGYGTSTNFVERMRVINSGEYGMAVNGRLQLRNGTTPLDPGNGPGIWLMRPDNTLNLGFIGVQNNQNMGFYGGPAGWGLTYDAVNSRVGIGNQNPNAPLAFATALGRKITFYQGTIGSAGIGVYGNELRVHSDNPNADITFGAENTGGAYIERMRIRGNGAISINGNAGSPGQVLQSSGSNIAPMWVAKPSIIFYNHTGSVNLSGSNLCADIAGVNGNSFTLPSAAMVSYTFSIPLFANNGAFGGNSRGFVVIQLLNAGGGSVSIANSQFDVGNLISQSVTVTGVGDLPAGTYSVVARVVRNATNDGNTASNIGFTGSVADCNDYPINRGQLIMNVIPK